MSHRTHTLRLGVLLAVLTSLPLSAQAPMAGTYTVDSAQPAGTTNFPTLASCVAALTSRGVSAPVTVDLIQNTPADFTTSTQWRLLQSAGINAFGGAAILVLDQFPGVSATNRVTFRTGSLSPIRPVVFDCSVHSVGVGVFFQGADYVTIEDIEIKGAAYDGIMLYGETGMFTTNLANAAMDHCWIRRCRIHDCAGTAITLYGNPYQPGFTRIENNFFWNNMKNCAGPLTNFGRFGHISGRRNHDVQIVHNSFYQDVTMQTLPGGLTPCMIGSNNSSGTAYALCSGNAFQIAGSGTTVPGGFYRWYTQGAITNVPSSGTGYATGTLLGHGRNFYFNTSGGTTFAIVGSTTVADLLGYQTLTTLDANSQAVDPQFAVPSTGNLDLATQASPAVDQGVTGLGITVDIHGSPRIGTAPDVGAMEARPPVLTASFGANVTSGQCPLTVNFADQSTTGGGPAVTSWQWAFDGDGTTQATTSNPTWTFTHTGTYSVSLVVSDGTQTASRIRTNYIVVSDSTGPVFSGCPTGPVLAPANQPNCAATVTWPPITASDGCGTVTLTSTHQPGSLFPLGTTPVTYTAVDNLAHVSTCTFDVTVTSVQPAIAVQPLNRLLCVGSTGTISVTAAAAGPPPTYQWKRGGVAIPGATQSVLTISNATTADSGSYTVVLDNGCGTITSNAATVSVLTGPVITQGPVNDMPCAGTQVILSVQATSPSPLSYQWRRNGVVIAGLDSPILTIPNALVTDSGIFDVTVSDVCSSTTSQPALIQITAPPAIAAQPLPVTSYPGVPASISVSAASTVPVTYQWRQNGTPIPGATQPAYVIGRLVPADAGMYDVVVTNSCGSVTSQAVPLSVTPFTLTIDQQPGPHSVHIHHTGGIPYIEYLCAVSFHAANQTQPGQGPWFGLFIDPGELVTEIFAAGPPFVGFLDANGDADFATPPFTITPNLWGTPVWCVTIMGDSFSAVVYGASNIATMAL